MDNDEKFEKMIHSIRVKYLSISKYYNKWLFRVYDMYIAI